MSVEVRQVNEPVYDGTTGNEVDTITRYELGAEINGAWVAFTSKSGEYVDALVTNAQKNAPQGQQQGQQQTGDTGAPQSSAVPTEPQTGQQTPTQDQSSQSGQ